MARGELARWSLNATATPRDTRAQVRALSVLCAIVAHAAIYGSLHALPNRRPAIAPRLDQATQLYDLPLPEAEPEPPAPVADAPEPEPDVPAPAPTLSPRPRAAPEPLPPPAAHAAPEPVADTPPPAAAQSAAALTADAPSDSADSIVSGSAAHYAGGTSASAGTAGVAVREVHARADGVVGGVGVGPVDRSRPASLLGGTAWDCPLPEEAEDEGILHATVQLRLNLTVDGRVASAEVVSDPGSGFAREALRCARQKRFTPALDKQGLAAATTQLVNVRF